MGNHDQMNPFQEPRLVWKPWSVEFLWAAYPAYPTATGIEIGLLLDFGEERLEFKHKTRTQRPSIAPASPQTVANKFYPVNPVQCL